MDAAVTPAPQGLSVAGVGVRAGPRELVRELAVEFSPGELVAILGRMATYSGQTIAWDQAMQSAIKLAPETYAMNATPPIVPNKDGRYPVSIPGVTRVV